MPPRLLLIGPGRANLQVLEAIARRRPRAEVVMVSPEAVQVHSRMVPGYVQGRYRAEDLAIDVGRLARAAGATLVEGRVARIDGAHRRVTLEDGAELSYDLAALAIGGAPAGSEVPGAQAHAFAARPLDRVFELTAALDRIAEPRPEPRRMVVVGAGSTGVELALCARARLDRQAASDVILTLVDSRSELFGGRLPVWSDLVARVLAEQDITLRLGIGVAEVGPDFVRLTDGRVQPADVVLWAAGPRAPALLRESRLPVDAHGFLLVDDTLEAQGTPGLFGAGDAVTLVSAPRGAGAGVIALRMGEVLADNLLAALAGERPTRRFQPRTRSLVLLNAGDGRALLLYGRLALASRWAMRLKDRLDRQFQARIARAAGGTGTQAGS